MMQRLQNVLLMDNNHVVARDTKQPIKCFDLYAEVVVEC
jgi:hypothetical protein